MEMMESYEEARLGPHADQCDLHDVKIHETCLSANCATLLASKQKFDFGAEIVGTPTISERESNMKTNGDSIATTATVAVAASSASPNDSLVSNIENPLSLVELPLKSNFGNDQDDHVDDDAEDDGRDSYQSDDDVDEDCNEESQQECGVNVHNDASQDSDESTSDSDFSDLSGLTDISGREWKPISARPINWVQKQIHAGANPRDLLSQMLPSNVQPIAPGVNDMMLWRILASMLSEPPRRQKLRYVNTFDDVIQLIQQSKNIIVLTGAGVSVSCGIPDFRSSDGIYSRLAKDFPNLPDPQAMFDINYFSRDPRPFYKFAREIYPGQFKPSPCHSFIKLLEAKQKLLRNYTQNIDTLEQVAGIKNVIECHGSFSTASCTKCRVKCTADAIREDIFSQRIPVCRRCQPNVHQSVNASDAVSDADLRQLVENGIMKPDIVFFGEGLPEEFHSVMASDKDRCDLLIVIGSSLKVRPVALIPSSIPANVPQILINREQLHHLEFDVELLGDSDVIINQLCHRLGDEWKAICYDSAVLKESKELLPLEEEDTNDDSEEDGQQMLDTDTQSVKSNASTDIALRSAGAYSDSGFESSTSSGIALAKPTNATATNIEANEAIEKIKSSILDLNHPIAKVRKDSDVVSVDYLEEPSDAVDFENRSFQPFNTRISDQHHHTAYGANTRHLSVDSSKDSGILGDSSNSAVISSCTVGTLPPPVTNFSDTGGTTTTNIDLPSASPTCTNHITSPAPAPTLTTTGMSKITNEADKKSAGVTIRRSTKKYRTAAERLLEGTYYAHDTAPSYVFPGAQVSWWSDVDDEDEGNDLIGNEYDDDDEDDIDGNGGPLSPLLPPSVEAEVVSEITTTSAFAICANRQALPAASYNNNISNELNETESEVQTAINSSNTTTTITTTSYTCNAIESTYERVSVTMPPSPSPSPKRRICECPPPTPSSSSNNNNNSKAETNENSSSCSSSSNSRTHKCDCSQPPLKRMRSIDDEDVLVNQPIKDLSGVFMEAGVAAAKNSNNEANAVTNTPPTKENALQQLQN